MVAQWVGSAGPTTRLWWAAVGAGVWWRGTAGAPGTATRIAGARLVRKRAGACAISGTSGPLHLTMVRAVEVLLIYTTDTSLILLVHTLGRCCDCLLS